MCDTGSRVALQPRADGGVTAAFRANKGTFKNDVTFHSNSTRPADDSGA